MKTVFAKLPMVAGKLKSIRGTLRALCLKGQLE